MWLFFIIASLLTFNALADNKERPPIYLRIDSGMSLPSDSFRKIKSPHYDNAAVDKTWFTSIGIGYVFNSNIRTDLILANRYLYTYYHSENDNMGNTSSTKQNFSNASLIANLYYDFSNTTIITPYINFGVGLSRNRIGKYNVYVNDVKEITSPSAIKCDFAWNVGIGLQAKLTQNFYADLFFKYVELGKFKNVAYTDLVNQVNEFSNPGSMKNKEFGLGLIYKF